MTRDGSRGRRAACWVGAVVVAWMLLGVVGAAAAAVVAVWHLRFRPAPRALLVAAVAAFGLVPVAWVVGNGARLGTVTPELVSGNPWPGALASAGLVLLVAGTLRDDRTAAGR